MNSSDDVLPRVRVMQIIASALMLGVTVFLVLILSGIFDNPRAERPMASGLLTIVAIVMLAAAAPLSFLVANFQTRATLKAIASGTWNVPEGVDAAAFGTDASKLLAARQISMIISFALLESAAFIGCTAYMLESRPLALGVVVAALLLMLMHFPTESRVRTWLQWQTEELEELRRRRT